MIKKLLLNLDIIVLVSTLLIVSSYQLSLNLFENNFYFSSSVFKFVYAQENSNGGGNDSGKGDGGNDSGKGDGGNDSGKGDGGNDSGKGDGGNDSGKGDGGNDSGKGDG